MAAYALPWPQNTSKHNTTTAEAKHNHWPFYCIPKTNTSGNQSQAGQRKASGTYPITTAVASVGTRCAWAVCLHTPYAAGGCTQGHAASFCLVKYNPCHHCCISKNKIGQRQAMNHNRVHAAAAAGCPQDGRGIAACDPSPPLLLPPSTSQLPPLLLLLLLYLLLLKHKALLTPRLHHLYVARACM